VNDAARIRSFQRSLEEAIAERSEPFAHGVGFFSDSVPSVYDANYLVLDRLATADEHAAEAEALMERFHHRKVVAFDGGRALARGFLERGWQPTTHLVMAHRRKPDRLVDTSSVRELTHTELAAVKHATMLAEPWGSVRLGEQLRVVRQRVGSSVSLRFFGAFADGQIAAYCELRSDGRTAQIEDVATLPAARGRGLGRAVVQFALEEAGRTHDVVFLEALEDDWPRELYAKLGFDVVDERHLYLLTGHPLTGLRLRTPRLELRLATVAELRSLARLALQGIHDPAEMPFEVAWTDNAGSPAFVDDFLEFHRTQLATLTLERWRLELVTFLDGEPIGTQGVGADDFASGREVSTGSWLGRRWQGRGLGTEQRAAVLTLAFEGLGAQAAVSAAWERNEASLGVSRKLGYVETGTKLAHPRGEPIVHRVLRLACADFRSPVPVEIEGLDALRSELGIATLA
jgi:RimJ/RimL family protein N-acetyltransferase/predicted GNAT family acetyltransferase